MDAAGKNVLLMRTWSDGEAELVRQILDGAGIPCVLSTSVSHNIFPLNVDGLGEIKILVAPEHLQDARDLLAEHLRDGLELIDGGLSKKDDDTGGS